MNVYDKLEQKAQSYEQLAQGLRLALAELKGMDTIKAHEHLNGKITKAAIMRGENLNGRAKMGKPRKPRKQQVALTKGAYKEAAINILKQAPSGYMSKEEFAGKLAKALGTQQSRGIGALARYAIIKKQGNGYVLGKAGAKIVSQEA